MTGRNLITEKYGYMMEFTDPAYYNANLRDRLPALTEAKAQLVAQIVSLQLVGYQKYAAAFPALAREARLNWFCAISSAWIILWWRSRKHL